MINPLIKVQYSDGIYQGQLSSCKYKHGIGIFLWENGSVYIGEWKNNLIEGEGIILIPQKIFIQGVFRNNKLHGATYFRTNEWVFEGYWCQGKPHGNIYARNIEFDQDQVLKFRNGVCETIIQRDVSNSPNRKKVFEYLSSVSDIFNKHQTNDQLKLGFLQDEDGSNYFGVINLNNQPSGIGVTQFLDGSYSCGQYQEGFLSGCGRVQQEDEQVYKGGFLRGQYQGNGILIYKALQGRDDSYIEWLRGIWASGYLVDTLDRGIIKDTSELEKLKLTVRYEFTNDEEFILQNLKVEIPIQQTSIKELENLVIFSGQRKNKDSETDVTQSQTQNMTEYSQESKQIKNSENYQKFTQHQQLTLQYLNQIYSKSQSKKYSTKAEKKPKNKIIQAKQKSQDDITKDQYPSTERQENKSFHLRSRQNSQTQSNPKITYIKNYYKGILNRNPQKDIRSDKQVYKQNKSQEPIVNYSNYSRNSEQNNKFQYNNQNLDEELTKIQIDNKAYSSSSCHFPGQNQHTGSYTVFKPEIQTTVQNCSVLKLIKEQVKHPSFNDLKTKDTVSQYKSPYQQTNHSSLNKQSLARSEGCIKSQNQSQTIVQDNSHQETAFERRLRKEFEDKNQNHHDQNNLIRCKLFQTEEETMAQIKLFQNEQEIQGVQKKQLLEPNHAIYLEETIPAKTIPLIQNLQFNDSSPMLNENEVFLREFISSSPHPLQAKPIDLQHVTNSLTENQTNQSFQCQINLQTKSMRPLNSDEQTYVQQNLSKDQTRSVSGLRNEQKKNTLMSNKQLEILKLANVFTRKDNIENKIKQSKVVRNELFLDDYDTEKKKNDDCVSKEKEIIETQTTPIYHFIKDRKQQTNLFTFKPQSCELQQTAGFNETDNLITQENQDVGDLCRSQKKKKKNKEINEISLQMQQIQQKKVQLDSQIQTLKNSREKQKSGENSVDSKILEQVQKQIQDQNDQIKCLAEVLHEVLLAQQMKQSEINNSRVSQNKSLNNLASSKILDKDIPCMIINRTQQQIPQNPLVIKAFPQVNQMVVNSRSRSPIVQIPQQVHLQQPFPHNRINQSPIRSLVRSQMMYQPQFNNSLKIFPKRTVQPITSQMIQSKKF